MLYYIIGKYNVACQRKLIFQADKWMNSVAYENSIYLCEKLTDGVTIGYVIFWYNILCPWKFGFKGFASSHSQVLKKRLTFRANIFLSEKKTIFWAIWHLIYDFKGGWIRYILYKFVSFTRRYMWYIIFNSFRLYIHSTNVWTLN